MSRPNVRTPANALRDITNKLPQKTVRNSKESSKQQKKSVTKQRQKGTLEKGTLDLNTKPNVEEEEIEYGPSPVEELPYEPFDEDLKFDWEPLRNMARVPSYEIENIELTFPKIDPDDYRSREVIDDYGK
ncbi:27214_t:CDS:2 [Gigaspora margarita]|uniref:27214_t:CDS:1 n=1 Tax=Gigaspora margarita TaxID=4874 RepID=A0ABN7UHZ4_GIGMA|nr:27214_t:CDS:2 [Gigaspora margarita]